jgi:hypothetical protein
MPSSRTVTVERLAEGSRRIMLDFTVPQDHELVTLSDETHTHLVYGLPDELEAHGLKEAPKAKPRPGEEVGGGQTAPVEKPKRKLPAKKKSAAKKPAAKKPSSKAKA